MPKPLKSLERRLEAIVEQPVQLEAWPKPGLPCWPGPRLIWYEGRMVPTRRACLTQLFQAPIHAGHRIRSTLACTSGWDEDRARQMSKDKRWYREGMEIACVNPHHAILYAVRGLSSGEEVPNLPLATTAAYVAEAENEPEDDLGEAVAWIETDPSTRKSRTAEQLHEDCYKTWSVEILKQALSVLQVIS